MKIVIETPENGDAFRVRIPQSKTDTELTLTQALSVVAAWGAERLLGSGTKVYQSWRRAMDHLDAASEELEQRLRDKTDEAAERWEGATPLERQMAQTLVAQEIESDPKLKVARGHADYTYKAFHEFIGSEAKAGTLDSSARMHAAVLGQLAGAVASALYALGEDHEPERLRRLYDEAEPVIQLLLGVPEAAADAMVTSKGGDA